MTDKELTTALAEKVMGFQTKSVTPEFLMKQWSPLTDWRAAMELAEKFLNTRGSTFQLKRYGSETMLLRWEAIAGLPPTDEISDSPHGYMQSVAGPWAVTLAIARAVGLPV